MSLQEILGKIKTWSSFLTRKDIYTALIILITASLSFCLGSLWQGDRTMPDMTINTGSASQDGDTIGTSTDPYIGSYTSKIYRLATCPGVSAINQDNRVYFATKADAEGAGYVAAKNCKM